MTVTIVARWTTPDKYESLSNKAKQEFKLEHQKEIDAVLKDCVHKIHAIDKMYTWYRDASEQRKFHVVSETPISLCEI